MRQLTAKMGSCVRAGCLPLVQQFPFSKTFKNINPLYFFLLVSNYKTTSTRCTARNLYVRYMHQMLGKITVTLYNESKMLTQLQFNIYMKYMDLDPIIWYWMVDENALFPLWIGGCFEECGTSAPLREPLNLLYNSQLCRN